MEKNLDIGIQTNDELINKDTLKNNYNVEKNIKLELKVNNLETELGNAVTYIINIENRSDKDLLNAKIMQKIQHKLKIICVIIDSVNIGNVDIYDEFITFYLGRIKSGENKIIEIVAQATDSKESEQIINCATLTGKYINSQNSDEDITVKSNTCSINVISHKLSLKHELPFIEAIVGETITLKLVAENKSKVDINNVIIRDLLSSELKFLNDTIRVNGIKKPNENILSGINIGDLKKGCSKEVVFDVEIISRPENGVITNVAVGEYQYYVQQGGYLSGENVTSDEVKILAQLASLKVDKMANKQEISLGDEVIYTISLENNGTVEIKDLVLNEIISEELSLIQGEFTINGKVVNNVDLSKGISIGDIQIEQVVIVKYKAKYIKVNKGSVINTTIVNFNYKQKSGLIFKGYEIKKSLELSSNITTFKYISISERIYKDRNKPNISEIDNVSAEVNILEYHLISSINGKSNEGQVLTGYKVVLQGIINLIIEYTSNEYNKAAYTLSSYVPFSTFIILPDNFKERSKVDIDYKIENISFTSRDRECVYVNICLLLIAKIQQLKG